MSKLFRIEEDDLAALERTLPELADALFLQMDGRMRVKIRRIQKILSDVRWDYGPPTNIEKVEDTEESA